MKVSVTYCGPARSFAQTSRESIELSPSATLDDLLNTLSKRHGDLMPSSILIFIGDEQIAAASPVPLKEGDQITLVSPISGG
jgi:molybdopterin converting factor small subunit